MSRNTDIFVSAADPEEIMRVVEQALGRPVTREDGSDPYIRLDPDAVYFGLHEFGDDDITWPDGTPVRLHSQYPNWIEVRDTDGDHERQEQLGGRILDALKAHGTWKAILIDDMQRVMGSWSPNIA